MDSTRATIYMVTFSDFKIMTKFLFSVCSLAKSLSVPIWIDNDRGELLSCDLFLKNMASDGRFDWRFVT